MQNLGVYFVCIQHFIALEEVFYLHYLDGMEVEEFKKFQLFLASRGLEVLDTAAFKDFVDNDVSKAIYNRLIEYYLDLMDQAKSYLVEESFYPEKADYLERSKETIVLLFDVCAFAPDNPEKSAIEFLRERFAWAPEPE